MPQGRGAAMPNQSVELRAEDISSKHRDRFWSRVARRTSGCWEWLGGTSRGYGSFGLPLGGRVVTRRAHRISYALEFGITPADLCVLHTCDNPSCVRPDHLFLGTDTDNIADKIRKGRGAKGSAIGLSKLTEDDVVKMRRLYRESETLGMEDIAKIYHVSGNAGREAIIGKTWSHVPGAVPVDMEKTHRIRFASRCRNSLPPGWRKRSTLMTPTPSPSRGPGVDGGG